MNDSSLPSDCDNVRNVPISALSLNTLSAICTSLNAPKVIPTDTGLPRDWKGLAHLMGLPGEHMPVFAIDSDPCGLVISKWSKTNTKEHTVRLLLSHLEELDRFDIIDDNLHKIDEDVANYKERRAEANVPSITSDMDSLILTKDDASRVKESGEPQRYDAFVLFAEEDIEYATQMIEILEKQYGLRLCVKDRDLIGGLAFEHGAIMRLIAERCNRLVIIVTNAFLSSSDKKFIVKFAAALGIDQGKRKIIPCLYENCSLPLELSYLFSLNYYRSGKLWNFWDKLRDSIQTCEGDVKRQQAEPSSAAVCRPPEFRQNLLQPLKPPTNSSSWSDLQSVAPQQQQQPQHLQPSTSCDNISSSSKKKSFSLSKIFGKGVKSNKFASKSKKKVAVAN